jgi:hypothetical protein
MELRDVAVATVTWVRSPAEEALLVRSLAVLADAGLPVAVADRGASATFGASLRHLPGFHVTVPAEQGLVPQVAAALEIAAAFDRRFVLYVEPDKELFMGPPLREFIRRAPDDDEVGVALAARSKESMGTFPEMQRYTEGVINHLAGSLIAADGDYSYGPFLMNRALLPHLTPLESRLGWGWRHFAFLRAHREGFRVHHVSGDYPCPPEQRYESPADRAHRLRQLSQNILGLIE